MSGELVLDLVASVGALAEGDTVAVTVRAPEDLPLVRAWCERTGNSVAAVADGRVLVRRGRPLDPLLGVPAERRPGTRLWIYTNFDCNLACDYCCVRSSPRAPRRALGAGRIRRLAVEAADAGVAELLLTGGEPFLLPDLGEIVAACAGVLPTTLLTNGMLFHGRRLATLRAMPRDRVRLQISLDSATPERHDAHRGDGSWSRALDGIRTALGEDFTVRVAATLVGTDPAEEAELRGFLSGLGVAAEHQVLRPLAHRGFAEEGLTLTTDTLVPEVTVTAQGVYWHPVGADDTDQLVTARLFPLAPAIAEVQELFRRQRADSDSRVRTFPCA